MEAYKLNPITFQLISKTSHFYRFVLCFSENPTSFGERFYNVGLYYLTTGYQQTLVLKPLLPFD